MTAIPDPFAARDTLTVGDASYAVYRLDALGTDLDRLPVTIKVLLENVLRGLGRGFVTEDDVKALISWTPNSGQAIEVPFMPGRVVLQDFTGVPCVVDLAAMRDAMTEMGGDPSRINPLVPADMVIDHSVQVDHFGDHEAFAENVAFEYERNGERYALLRWAQQAFDNFRVVPPGMGIVHQVNLEYLAPVVDAREIDGELVAFPDTLVGTDSHTTMINGIGVIGFGVGGIEAEAVMLGQPLSLPMPIVVGLKLTGALPAGATATDLVLTVTELLRKHGRRRQVRRGLRRRALLAVAGRPRHDRQHVAGVRRDRHPVPGRRGDAALHDASPAAPREIIARTEAYTKLQQLFRTDATPDPQYDENVELDLSTVVPSLPARAARRTAVAARPRRRAFREAFPDGLVPANGQRRRHYPAVTVEDGDETFEMAAARSRSPRSRAAPTPRTRR